MYKIAVCDDNIEIVKKISSFLTDISASLSVSLLVEPYFSTVKFLKILDAGEKYDIVLMDIELPSQNGIDATKIIRENFPDQLVIFISSYEKYFMELFDVEPFRFIKKPINREKFDIAILQAIKKLERLNAFFEYTKNKVQKRERLSDIIFFESNLREITIHTVSGNDSFYSKLNTIEEKVASTTLNFIRIHQSFLINYQFIKNYNGKSVTLFSGENLVISSDRQKKVKQQYFKLLQTDYH